MHLQALHLTHCIFRFTCADMNGMYDDADKEDEEEDEEDIEGGGSVRKPALLKLLCKTLYNSNCSSIGRSSAICFVVVSKSCFELIVSGRPRFSAAPTLAAAFLFAIEAHVRSIATQGARCKKFGSQVVFVKQDASVSES